MEGNTFGQLNISVLCRGHDCRPCNPGPSPGSYVFPLYLPIIIYIMFRGELDPTVARPSEVQFTEYSPDRTRTRSSTIENTYYNQCPLYQGWMGLGMVTFPGIVHLGNFRGMFPKWEKYRENQHIYISDTKIIYKQQNVENKR